MTERKGVAWGESALRKLREAVVGLIGGGLSLAAVNAADALTGNGEQAWSEPRAVLSAPEPTERDWSVQLGVAFITGQNIGEIFGGKLSRAEGAGEGEAYSLTLGYVAHRFEVPFRERVLKPQLETYLTLTLVDERGRSVFPDYNGGVGFRWVDFPWDRWVDTGFFMGVGLSYSGRVYQIDRVRHPERDRSHLKFDWPIQLTFAIPQWPEHQLVIYNDHQSGGRIMDRGGVNSLGVAYRLEF
jgi:hypothetical protein